eukprot:SAG31_NODE_11126_length_1063_cov_1.533195_1_plen_80_part_01
MSTHHIGRRSVGCSRCNGRRRRHGGFWLCIHVCGLTTAKVREALAGTKRTDGRRDESLVERERPHRGSATAIRGTCGAYA